MEFRSRKINNKRNKLDSKYLKLKASFDVHTQRSLRSKKNWCLHETLKPANPNVLQPEK